MLGEVVHYKFFSVGFGRYCQIHEEDEPRNSNNARTQGLLIVPWEGYDDDVMALLIAHARAMLLSVYLLL